MTPAEGFAAREANAARWAIANDGWLPMVTVEMANMLRTATAGRLIGLYG